MKIMNLRFLMLLKDIKIDKFDKNENFIWSSHFLFVSLQKIRWNMTKEDWVNVNDALPDVDVKCLCATSNGKIMVSSMYIPKDCYGKILGDKKWHGSSSTTSSITHWMYVVLP